MKELKITTGVSGTENAQMVINEPKRKLLETITKTDAPLAGLTKKKRDVSYQY